MIFGRIVIDKEEMKRCPANVTPGNNPRLLDLAEFDREHSTGTKDNYVRAMERMLVEHLMPLYLKELFGQNGWRPYLGDENCGDWHGFELVNTEEIECIEANFRIETIVMTFRMGAELTNAFSLPEESVAKVLIQNNDLDHNFYFQDAHDAIKLRIVDRQMLIDGNSLQQLQGMQAYLETIIPILMMKNV